MLMPDNHTRKHASGSEQWGIAFDSPMVQQWGKL